MANTTSKNKKTFEPAKPPVLKLRIGLLSASIWEHTTEKGTFHTVAFERRYRDAKGDWHGTQSFDKTNLLILAKLADQADTEIARLTASLKTEQTAA